MEIIALSELMVSSTCCTSTSSPRVVIDKGLKRYSSRFAMLERVPAGLKKCQLKWKKDKELEGLLIDLSDRGLFPRNIVALCLSRCKEIKSKLRAKNVLKQFSAKEVVAYTLYLCLVENKITRSPLEISRYFQMSVKKLWKVEKHVGILPRCDTVSDYIERFVSLLKLPYHYGSKMKELFLQLYGYGGMTPQCLAVALIFLYCKHHCRTRFSLTYICEVCGISAGNIRNNIKNKQLEVRISSLLNATTAGEN